MGLEFDDVMFDTFKSRRSTYWGTFGSPEQVVHRVEWVFDLFCAVNTRFFKIFYPSFRVPWLFFVRYN